MCDSTSQIFWVSQDFTATQSVRVKCVAKIIKKSGISSVKMSGKSAKCVTMSGRVAHQLVRPKMSKNTPNVWQLAGMHTYTLVCDIYHGIIQFVACEY